MSRSCPRLLGRSAARLLAAAIGLGPLTPTAAHAQGRPPWPPPPMESPCTNRDALLAARMAFIETKLALKPEQKPQWDAFVTASRNADKPLGDLCQAPPGPPSFGDLFALLELRHRMAALHAEHEQAMWVAVGRLKGALDAEQQRRLAEALLTPPPMPGPPGMRGFPPAGFAPHLPPAGFPPSFAPGLAPPFRP